jgi:hypothetical protein
MAVMATAIHCVNLQHILHQPFRPKFASRVVARAGFQVVIPSCEANSKPAHSFAQHFFMRGWQAARQAESNATAIPKRSASIRRFTESPIGSNFATRKPRSAASARKSATLLSPTGGRARFGSIRAFCVPGRVDATLAALEARQNRASWPERQPTVTLTGTGRRPH